MKFLVADQKYSYTSDSLLQSIVGYKHTHIPVKYEGDIYMLISGCVI